ncbi:MAG: hypothetical protein U9N32_03620 [Spirochaetota bacterium]|nr:hypothetical protein [Spirochaetota bacterium]
MFGATGGKFFVNGMAGDAATGASLVVRAFAHGRDATISISEYLKLK